LKTLLFINENFQVPICILTLLPKLQPTLIFLSSSPLPLPPHAALGVSADVKNNGADLGVSADVKNGGGGFFKGATGLQRRSSR
jgi:hypothetical protein